MERFPEFKKILRTNVPLAMHTWFQLGGPAQFFAEPKNEGELIALLKRCAELSIPVRVLGGGSNVIVSDEGVSGMVIRLTASCFCEIQAEQNMVVAGGGAKLGRAVTGSIYAGFGGIESLIGVPGTVGGAVIGNTGGSGGTIGQWISRVRAVDEKGEVLEYGKNNLSFAPGESFLRDTIILDVTLTLEKEDSAELAKRLQKIWIIKKTMYPTGHQSSGFIFRNPRGMQASELIERAGLKGTRIGGAVVSDRNANFIVAEPECTSSDILRLIELVRSQVFDRLDVELELKIEIW